MIGALFDELSQFDGLCGGSVGVWSALIGWARLGVLDHGKPPSK